MTSRQALCLLYHQCEAVSHDAATCGELLSKFGPHCIGNVTQMVENSQNPLVSIILPTYNRAHTLLRAVNSVLNQEYREIELIVVDDASTDGSAAVLDTLTDPRLRVIRHERNKGVAGATNTGLHAARSAHARSL